MIINYNQIINITNYDNLKLNVIKFYLNNMNIDIFNFDTLNRGLNFFYPK